MYCCVMISRKYYLVEKEKCKIVHSMLPFILKRNMKLFEFAYVLKINRKII